MVKAAAMIVALLAAGACNVAEAQGQQQGQSAGQQAAADVTTARQEQMKAVAGAINTLQVLLKGVGQGQSAAAATQSLPWQLTMTCTEGAQCASECVRMQELPGAVCQSRQVGCSCTFP